MNWIKCQKTYNCKLCSDYMYCKDDIRERKKKKNKKGRKTNESKSNKKLSR